MLNKWLVEIFGGKKPLRRDMLDKWFVKIPLETAMGRSFAYVKIRRNSVLGREKNMH